MKNDRLLIVVAAIGIFLFSRQQALVPPPAPIPANDVKIVVADAVNKLKSGYANCFKEASTQITANIIKTDDDLQKMLSEATKKTREFAWSDIDALIERDLPRSDDGVLLPGAAAYMSIISEGFK